MLTLGTIIQKQSKNFNLSNSSKIKNLQNAYNKNYVKEIRLWNRVHGPQLPIENETLNFEKHKICNIKVFLKFIWNHIAITSTRFSARSQIFFLDKSFENCEKFSWDHRWSCNSWNVKFSKSSIFLWFSNTLL